MKGGREKRGHTHRDTHKDVHTETQVLTQVERSTSPRWTGESGTHYLQVVPHVDTEPLLSTDQMPLLAPFHLIYNINPSEKACTCDGGAPFSSEQIL